MPETEYSYNHMKFIIIFIIFNFGRIRTVYKKYTIVFDERLARGCGYFMAGLKLWGVNVSNYLIFILYINF
jgi:hypothetical protein